MRSERLEETSRLPHPSFVTRAREASRIIHGAPAARAKRRVEGGEQTRAPEPEPRGNVNARRRSRDAAAATARLTHTRSVKKGERRPQAPAKTGGSRVHTGAPKGATGFRTKGRKGANARKHAPPDPPKGPKIGANRAATKTRRERRQASASTTQDKVIKKDVWTSGLFDPAKPDARAAREHLQEDARENVGDAVLQGARGRPSPAFCPVPTQILLLLTLSFSPTPPPTAPPFIEVEEFEEEAADEGVENEVDVGANHKFHHQHRALTAAAREGGGGEGGQECPCNGFFCFRGFCDGR
ncbi:hypothetical protein B0H16DRAFT_1728338 [Mycena metata]|uniref:Uncharacterized protein n=1 Tax=Mycena metata TaxID=1033252 RepID=A0AAD7II68_9AGAR|nr:hypothetical protein B0H16DRAFT_1728338 [Mycena metata]